MIPSYAEVKVDTESGVTSSLLSANEIISNAIPVNQDKLTGVYFLIDGDEIVYVGQSRDVVSRVSFHMKNLVPFDRYFYIHCPEGALDVLESIYIHILSPSLNGDKRNGKSAPKSFDSVLKMIQIKVPEDGSWDLDTLPDVTDESSELVKCIAGLMELCEASIQDLSDMTRIRKSDIHRWLSGRSSKDRTFSECRRALVGLCQSKGVLEKEEQNCGPAELLRRARSGAKDQGAEQ